MLWAGLRLWGRQLRASGTRALCPQEFSAVCAQLPELVQDGPAWRKIPRIVGTVKAVGVAIVARKTRKVYRVRTRIRSRSLIGGATRYLAGGEVGRLAICRLDAPDLTATHGARPWVDDPRRLAREPQWWMRTENRAVSVNRTR